VTGVAPLENAVGVAGVAANVFGVIVHHSPEHGLAHVHFDHSNLQAPVGSYIGVYERAGEQRRLLAKMQVVNSFPGSANVTGSPEAFATIAQGDVVFCPAGSLLAEASANYAEAAEVAVEAAPAAEQVAVPAAPVFEEDYTEPVAAPLADDVLAASSEMPAAEAAAAAGATPAATAPAASAAPTPVMARRPVTAIFMR
jgi:hypothetical protein